MNATNSSEAVTEIEVLYRAAALMGLLAGGCELDAAPDLAKNLAGRMMIDSNEGGLAAIKPKRTRK